MSAPGHHIPPLWMIIMLFPGPGPDHTMSAVNCDSAREPGLDPDKENKNRSAHKVRRHSQLSDSSLCRLNSVFIGIVRTPVGYLRSERRVGLN